MAEPSRAVFLSYASQDAEAALRICEALRAAGIEVWFDQNELRGGDAWDTTIRRQIKACGLFIPVISRSTHAREEGYFRLEWKLAVDRSHLMTGTKAFLLPVVIDDTRDDDENTPDKFREVQWTRLPDGDTPPAFVERVSRLLSPDRAHESVRAHPPTSGAPGAGSPPSAGTARPSTSRRKNPAVLLITAVAVIGAGYLALDKFVLSKRGTDAARTVATAQSVVPSPTVIPERSIAVLPFVDMSEKKDQEYFSDGLSEELIDLLTKITDLKVPARTSSFYFKGQHTTIREIAKALSVAHVLEGSVRKAGNTIRVTAQLVRADNGYHLWSQTYDRDLKDVFKVQDEIAGAVVSALKLKIVPALQSSSAHRTSNTEAYNQYLLGRQFYDRSNLDDYRRAVEAYRKAVQLDPRFAAAYAELAIAESFVADFTGDAAVLRQAVAAADKAVVVGPDEASGYVARGFLRFNFSWDWTGAQADFERALALDPGSSTVQRWYGGLLATVGRLTEGIAATKKAVQSDPLSSPAWSTLGLYLTRNGEFAAAHEAIRRALEIQPESAYALSGLGTLQLLEGKAADALATFRQDSEKAFRLPGIAMTEHSLGHAKESQQALEELIAKDSQDAAYQIADVYAWRGEKDHAFEWLERAYQQRDGGLSEIKIDVLLASLRGDPRDKALLRKMNLPE